MKYKTEQENFWAEAFGQDYIERNQGEHWVSANVGLFSKILARTPRIESIAELGRNIGLNLQALNRISQHYQLRGYEINPVAAAEAEKLGYAEIVQGTIAEPLTVDRTFDLVFTKGVLIHINPDMLPVVYENLVNLSSQYILVCEYYNPSPVTINYRGNEDRLFKRDFAGELMEQFGLTLVDYGFAYRRDPVFPQDDLSWFLLSK